MEFSGPHHSKPLPAKKEEQEGGNEVERTPLNQQLPDEASQKRPISDGKQDEPPRKKQIQSPRDQLRETRRKSNEFNRLTKKERREAAKALRNQQPPIMQKKRELTKNIGHFSKQGLYKEAHNLFKDFMASHPQCDQYESFSDVYNQMLRICCGGKNDDYFDVEEANDIFRKLQAKGGVKEATFSMMINANCKMNKIDEALLILEDMKRQNHYPKLRTYRSFLEAYANLGDMEGGFGMFNELKEDKDFELEERDYVTMIHLATKGQDQNRFHGVMNEFMENVFLPRKETWETLKQWFRSPAAGGDWKCQEAEINEEDGKCSACGRKLCSVYVSDIEREQMVFETLNLAVNSIPATCDEPKEHFKDFAQKITEKLKTQKIYAVLDGANIGYKTRKNQESEERPEKTNLMLIDIVVKHLQSESQNGIILILHERHLADPPDEYKEIIKRWKEEEILFEVPRGGANDDFYWIWATLKCGGNTLMITNDKMRDHHFNLLVTKPFKIWRERHMTRFYFDAEEEIESDKEGEKEVKRDGKEGTVEEKMEKRGNDNALGRDEKGDAQEGNESEIYETRKEKGGKKDKNKVVLKKPPPYSIRMQKDEDGSAWHFPDEEALGWLCIHRST